MRHANNFRSILQKLFQLKTRIRFPTTYKISVVQYIALAMNEMKLVIHLQWSFRMRLTWSSTHMWSLSCLALREHQNYNSYQQKFPVRQTNHLTLNMTSAQVVETSVNVISNSPSQDYTHPDDRTYERKSYTRLSVLNANSLVSIITYRFVHNHRYPKLTM